MRLRNILLPAGGFGTRLDGYRNPYACKSLVQDQQGTTLLEHTLQNIRDADVAEKVIVLTRSDVRRRTEEILLRVGMPYVLLDHSGLIGMRRIPVVFRNELENEPFLLMCGHAPALPEHLQSLVASVQSSEDIGVSLYPSSQSGISESRIFTSTDSGCVTSLKKNPGKFFIESPFILTTAVIDELESSGSVEWIGESLRKLHGRGAVVRSVAATCPVESDYPKQLDATISWITRACRTV